MPVAAVSQRGELGGEARVEDGDGRVHGAVDDDQLARALLVLDDGDVRRLAPRARGGGDGHQRQAGGADLVDAVPARGIPAVARQERRGLAGVDGAAAAEGDDSVRARPPGLLGAGEGRLARRVGLGVGPHRVHAAAAGLGDAVGEALGRDARVAHQEGARDAESLEVAAEAREAVGREPHDRRRRVRERGERARGSCPTIRHARAAHGDHAVTNPTRDRAARRSRRAAAPGSRGSGAAPPP